MKPDTEHNGATNCQDTGVREGGRETVCWLLDGGRQEGFMHEKVVEELPLPAPTMAKCITVKLSLKNV